MAKLKKLMPNSKNNDKKWQTAKQTNVYSQFLLKF